MSIFNYGTTKFSRVPDLDGWYSNPPSVVNTQGELGWKCWWLVEPLHEDSFYAVYHNVDREFLCDDKYQFNALGGQYFQDRLTRYTWQSVERWRTQSDHLRNNLELHRARQHELVPQPDVQPTNSLPAALLASVTPAPEPGLESQLRKLYEALQLSKLSRNQIAQTLGATALAALE